MRRLAATPVLLALAASASANGAMGLGLEIFNLTIWFAYVIATVIFEAWYIGRWAKQTWPASLGISLVANLCTATCGMVCTSPLHSSFVGSRLNPNPFLNALLMLTVMGLLSGLVEAAIWDVMRRKAEPQTTFNGSLLWRSTLAHLLGIGLALSVLLLPPRPYVGTEIITRHARRMYLDGRMIDDFGFFLRDENPIPSATSLEELLSKVPGPHSGPEDWVAAYDPQFGRFSLGEDRRTVAYEWNSSLGGRRLTEGETGTVWLARRRTDGKASGWILDLESAEVIRSAEPKELGY